MAITTSHRAILLILIFFVVPASGCSSDPDCEFQPSSSAQSSLIPDGLGVNIHFTDPQPGELNMLAASGVRWVRMDFKWDITERVKGVYDFVPYDRLMAALQPFGIRALFILDYGNPLYDEDGPPRDDASRQAFAKWAVAAARHFAGRGIVWETYNEPNNQEFWRPRPNVEEYAKLALTVGRAFREAVPEEKLIGPAVGEMDFRFLEGSLKAGLLEYWSGVSVHPYLRSDPEHVVSGYCRLRKLIDTYAPVKGAGSVSREMAIISSEWGYSSAWRGLDREKQGQLLARQWLINLANGVSLSIWYDWRDDGTDADDPEHNFGMVANSYQQGREQVYEPKPAYFAARTLTKFLAGHRFEKRLRVGGQDDYVFAFRDGGSYRFAAWTTAGREHRVTVPLAPGQYTSLNHLGTDSRSFNADQSGAAINLTRSPIYFR
jgi:polysaccharide biosynthesis protein PslG